MSYLDKIPAPLPLVEGSNEYLRLLNTSMHLQNTATTSDSTATN